MSDAEFELLSAAVVASASVFCSPDFDGTWLLLFGAVVVVVVVVVVLVLVLLRIVLGGRRPRGGAGRGVGPPIDGSVCVWFCAADDGKRGAESTEM